MLAAAAPAWAARVVDVRVGQHAGFSRVVFELDSPVGYKVERNTPASGISELVVSLDAAAPARRIDRKLAFIESVEIVPGAGNRSTVRVRLKGKDLKLKEMILASPPRIVLDILSESAVADARVKAEAQRVKAEAQKKKKQAAAAAAKAREAEAAKQALSAKQPSPVEIVRSEMAKPQPPASLPAGDAGQRSAVKRELAMNANPTAAQPVVAPTPPPGKQPTPTRTKPPTAVLERPTPVPAVAPKPAPIPPVERPAPKPAATARPKATPPAPASATPPAADGGLFSITNLTVGAVGLLLLVAAGVVFMRRRSAVEVVDASAFESPLDDDENPFASLEPAAGAAAGDEVEAETEEIPISEAARAAVGVPIPERGTPASESTKPVPEGTDMDMVSENAQTTIMNGSPSAAMSGGGDTANLIAEFERRMAAMETRIDELVDAKERLERQVAAQTEELRVQRAAIARTQRAVRNLSRPGEDAPTEPALRDPARPEGPREE